MSNLRTSAPTNSFERLNSNNWADLNYRYQSGYFPKEYKRSLSEYFDKRFGLIWLMTFIIHFSTAVYFANNPPDTSVDRSEIDLIQKQFVSLVLEREMVTSSDELAALPPEVTKLTGVTQGTGGPGKGSGRRGGGLSSEQAGGTNLATTESRMAGHYSAAEGRVASREQISNEVSSKGLLGLLTGSGGTARGEAIKDVLGEAAGTQGDLDKVLGNLDGLKRTGKPSTGTVSTGISSAPGAFSQKGTRSTTGGGIDDLIAGKEEIKAANFQRKGNIVVEEVSVVADERGFRSESRNPDQVSEIVNGHNSSIQYCYQRELKQNPDLKGKLVVRFTITPEGKVKDVKIISSTLDSPSIERCVISRILRWDDFGAIDPTKGDATFKQVYTFGY